MSVDRWRYLRGTPQPPRVGAAQMATQRQLRQKMVKPYSEDCGETGTLTLYVARVSAASPATATLNCPDAR